MDTIDYPTREELVAAVVDFRNKGVHVEIVHHGLTLQFPNGVEETPEDQAAEVFTQEQEAPADGIEKTPVEGDTLLGVVEPEEMDRSTFTVEGTCSACEQPALAEPDGTWVHAEAATHGDNEGEFVPNEPAAEDEDEDIIGAADTAQSSSKRKRK